MPSSATITSFYTFAQGGLIRASEHNTNWSNIRGHFLPIHPDTATAATSGAYDLGASDHRWGTLYVTTINSTNPVGGGGGGSALIWSEQANAPVSEVVNYLDTYKFTAGLAQALYATVVVPSTYNAGTQITLNINWFTDGAAGNVLMSAIVYHIVPDSTDVTGALSNRTTSNTADSGFTQNAIRSTELDLTDGSGQISAAVAAGDILLIALYRDAADTNTGDVYLLRDSIELSFT